MLGNWREIELCERFLLLSFGSCAAGCGEADNAAREKETHWRRFAVVFCDSKRSYRNRPEKMEQTRKMRENLSLFVYLERELNELAVSFGLQGEAHLLGCPASFEQCK